MDGEGWSKSRQALSASCHFPPGSVLTLYMNRCNCASSADVLAANAWSW